MSGATRPGESLSTSSPPSQKPAQPDHYTSSLEHAPRAHSPSHEGCRTERLQIKVENSLGGSLVAFVHIPHTTTAPNGVGAILLSGAGGGVSGPSGIYLSIADKLASLARDQAIPTLRMDYRHPARNKHCVPNVLAAMEHLQSSHLGLQKFVLVGWSFGGAPVFTVGGTDRRVIGCAAIASQRAETDGIRALAPTPALLLHGTGDCTLSSICSERLYESYGPRGDRTLKSFKGDDHALTRNSKKAEELICHFILRCAGVKDDQQVGEKIEEDLSVNDKDGQVNLMKLGGDLKGGGEHVD